MTSLVQYYCSALWSKQTSEPAQFRFPGYHGPYREDIADGKEDY